MQATTALGIASANDDAGDNGHGGGGHGDNAHGDDRHGDDARRNDGAHDMAHNNISQDSNQDNNQADGQNSGAVPIAVRRVRWTQACRIVPTRYPSINLFDRVASADDFDALYALEAMSNERARAELGHIERVPPEQRLFGPGSGPIMAAFTHVNVQGSRFSDGSYGVFYAARERATAVDETRYHHGRFLAATRQVAMHLPMRLYSVAIDTRLHDLRPAGAVNADVYDADNYAAAQALGRSLHAAGSGGVVYRSVRHARGQCVGLFRTTGASGCLHSAYLLYAWDGAQFTDVYEKTA